MKVIENEPATDEQLLVEAAQRDPLRFAELYDNNFDRVYAFVARRVENRQDAEDLTAEVFHEALRNLHRFEWRGLPFAAWLLGIAANRMTDRWRRAGRQPEFAVDDLDQNGCDPKTEQSVMLSQLVNELPHDQRLVIFRRFVGQQSLQEVATELGRSTGAIKQLWQWRPGWSGERIRSRRRRRMGRRDAGRTLSRRWRGQCSARHF